jgi:hypothetical protein
MKAADLFNFPLTPAPSPRKEGKGKTHYLIFDIIRNIDFELLPFSSTSVGKRGRGIGGR